jgi:hypothetical protein
MRYGQAMRREREILERGVSATAVPRALPREIPGDAYGMRVPLEVHPRAGAPYRLDWVFHSALMKAPLHIGVDVPVKVDPGDPSRVAVDWDAYQVSLAARGGEAAAVTKGFEEVYGRAADAVAREAKEKAAADDPATKVRKLAQMRDAGLITSEEYLAKSAEAFAEPWKPKAAPEQAEPARVPTAPVPTSRVDATPERGDERAEETRGVRRFLGRRSLDVFTANPGGPGADRYGRVAVPGLETVELPAGHVAIYYEQSWDPGGRLISDDGGFWVPHDLWLRVTEVASGNELAITFPPGAELGSGFLRSAESGYLRFGVASYRRPGLARAYVGRIDVPRRGRYTVETDVDAPYPGPPHVALGA